MSVQELLLGGYSRASGRGVFEYEDSDSEYVSRRPENSDTMPSKMVFLMGGNLK